MAHEMHSLQHVLDTPVKYKGSSWASKNCAPLVSNTVLSHFAHCPGINQNDDMTMRFALHSRIDA